VRPPAHDFDGSCRQLTPETRQPIYELWDAELGVPLGSYQSEDEALAAVRTLCEQSLGLRAPLGLIRDGTVLVATGDQLVERALSRA
jgi:hypothetical protein